jgi:hypothetical protein
MKRALNFAGRMIFSGVTISMMFFASSVKADFIFGVPVNLGPVVNSPNTDFTQWISADGLSLFIASNRPPGGYQDFDLWVTTRQAGNEEWGAPVHLGDNINSRQNEWAPCLSADGLSLYFAKGAWGNTDLWIVTRDSLDTPWGVPESLGPVVNSSSWDAGPSISADGLELFFMSIRPGGYGGPDIYVTKRATTADRWGPPENLGPTVNTAYGNSLYGEWSPCISQDGLTLFFASARPPGSASNLDIWMTRRATRGDPWQPPVHLGFPVNSLYEDSSPCVSADGHTLYFTSGRPGGYGGDTDFWQVPINPLVDFNADEIVNLADLVMLIENWGTDNTLYDIGPFPWGDGIVDAADLEVLMSYWGQEIPSADLIGHWKLDEAYGGTAADVVKDNNGILLGEPLWQPTGGKLGGALQLDGVDDCILTSFAVDPSAGPFSIFAWVKGGAPGQVILSQAKGAAWLVMGANGRLRTDLKSGERGKGLESPVFIMDGAWHRVGFAWDGSNRILYVDDSEAARDKPGSLAGSTGGLIIGAGADLEVGTFWSGLIDDVRIYKRAVMP